MTRKTVYLDNAATTFPKPPGVITAVADAIRNCGNPGRGAHKLAINAAEELYACRKAAAKMFGASSERVIFTGGATHSLNIALNTLKNNSGAILLSDLEHNSVVRPAAASGKELRIFKSCTELTGNPRTAAILNSIDEAAGNATALVTTAASNICGASMPISDIGALCRDKGILFIVDGAQAGGTADIDIKRDGIDILCLPGHKGLYGPMGCGLLILSEKTKLEPLMYGGSGIDSKSPNMPELPPERYEAGTLPLPLIAGLRRGIEFVKSKKQEAIKCHEERLAKKLKQLLEDIGATVYCKNHHGGIVLFDIDGFPSEQTADYLSKYGICTRAGLHCAPFAHQTIGSNGGVRVSFGAFNTEKDVFDLMDALYIMKSKK